MSGLENTVSVTMCAVGLAAVALFQPVYSQAPPMVIFVSWRSLPLGSVHPGGSDNSGSPVAF